MNKYRKKSIAYLTVLLLLFFAIFVIGTLGLYAGFPIIQIGLNASITNVIIMIFSFLAIMMVIYEVIKI